MRATAAALALRAQRRAADRESRIDLFVSRHSLKHTARSWLLWALLFGVPCAVLYFKARQLMEQVEYLMGAPGSPLPAHSSLAASSPAAAAVASAPAVHAVALTERDLLIQVCHHLSNQRHTDIDHSVVNQPYPPQNKNKFGSSINIKTHFTVCQESCGKFCSHCLSFTPMMDSNPPHRHSHSDADVGAVGAAIAACRDHV